MLLKKNSLIGSIILVHLLLLINLINGQVKTLIKEALSSVDLSCDDPFPIWYKTPDILIGENNIEDEHFKIEVTGSRPNRKRHLIIKKLNSTDVGHKIYYDHDKYSECYFNIHLYDNKNYNGHLKINNVVFRLNDTDNFDLELNTNKPMSLEYQYEGLPLDNLKVNNEIVNSTECQSGRVSPWLSCRNANLTNSPFLKIEKCQTKLNLNLSYTVEHSKEFQDEKITVAIRNFQKNINFLFPPKTKSKEINLNFNETKNVILNCEVECGNPNNFTYQWQIDGKEVVKGKYDQYGLDLKTLSNNSTKVVCTVFNSINANDLLSESQTVFNIRITNETVINEMKTSSKPTTLTTTQITTTPLNVTTTSAVHENITVTTAFNNQTSTSTAFMKPENATSMFGFFANVYNKYKFYAAIIV